MNDEIPLTVQAVDAFGVDAVQDVFPDWERRNDLREMDFAKVAARSKAVFASDGKVVLPEAYLHLKETNGRKLYRLQAAEAFQLFGMQILSRVSEKGFSTLPALAGQRLERYVATREKAKPVRIKPLRPSAKSKPFVTGESRSLALKEEPHKFGSKTSA